MKTTTVARHHKPGAIEYCLVENLPTLVWAANLGDLELHTFLSRAPSVHKPTQIVFDLDPGAPADAVQCAQVALWIRGMFAGLGLECFIKSSGSKGMQLYVPLNTPATYAETSPFAKTVAQALENAHPELVVSDMKKVLRKGKVLVDWSLNSETKTTVCVYSLRAKEHPYVSLPLEWSEVEQCLKKKDASLVMFEAAEALKRIEKKGDIFAPVLTLKQSLRKALKAFSGSRRWPSAGRAKRDLRGSPRPPGAGAAAAASPNSAKRSGSPRWISAGATAVASPKTSHAKRLKGTGDGTISAYNAKRDFTQTTEPAGKTKRGGKLPLFVIQKHDASHLHYDFRLELDGVLKSWAVPKGPQTDMQTKRLAMMVEDHPLDYAHFEGIIPKGNYGGGTVMVWDIGTWENLGPEPHAGLKSGKLHFQLNGKKLKGEWALVKMHGPRATKGNEWLLLKHGTGMKPISAKRDDSSAVTGRSMAKIAAAKDKVWE